MDKFEGKKVRVYTDNIKFHKTLVISYGKEKSFLVEELSEFELLKITSEVQEYNRRIQDIKNRLVEIDKSMEKSLQAILRGCNGIQDINTKEKGLMK